jgi:DNA-binding NarL/FixJ family response regulator
MFDRRIADGSTARTRTPRSARAMGDRSLRDNASVTELTVLLADDQVATRAGVARALESDGLRVVAQATTVADAVEAALEHRPDVCVIAVQMPGNGIRAAEKIVGELPDTKVVMLTESDRDDDLFAAVRAGAVGYLRKTTSAARLPHAIRGVVHGEAALPRELTARLLREFRDAGRRRRVPLMAGKSVELTAREFEVLQLLRANAATSEIASALHISDVTVRRHVSAILRKLGVPDRRSALELIEHEERRNEDANRG